MVTLHGNQLLIYYDPESAEGTSRTGQTWKVLAHHSTADITEEDEPVLVKKSGSVDGTSNEKGKQKAIARITFNPSEADGKFFMKTYASSDTAVSMIFKNASGSFLWRMVGCKVKSINPSCSKYPTHGPCSITMEIWGWKVLFTEPATTSYTSVPDGFVNWADTTVKIASVTQSLWWDWAFTITNDLDVQHDETGAVNSILRGDRELDLTITKALEDTASTQFGQAFSSFATVALEIDLLTDLYQFGACAYKVVQVTHARTGAAGLQLRAQPATLTIA